MFLVYGIGEIGICFIRECLDKKIDNLLLTDSNTEQWGQQVEGFTVLAPDIIDYQEIELAVVTTAFVNYGQVQEFLSKKIDNGKIIYYSEALLLSDQDVLNLGNVKLKEDFVSPAIYKRDELYQYFDPSSFNELDCFFYCRNHRLIHKFVHYTEAYDRHFSQYRGKKVKVLEIGVSKGGSLQMWKHYFGVYAEIIGVDIDPSCKELEEEQIKIYIGDQGDPVFLQQLKKDLDEVDIIIDDGGHTMQQQIISFEELFAMVSEKGIYLCEDCHTSYWSSYGGGYKHPDTFMEYAKTLTDGLNLQYLEECAAVGIIKKRREFLYQEEIKTVTFYDSMVFIEKRNKTNKSIALQVSRDNL